VAGADRDLTTPTAWQRLWAFVRLRCPRCCRGRMFHGAFGMHDPCPVCGLIFRREDGYFLGAMYVSYVICTVLLGGGFFLASWLLPRWSDFAVMGLVILLYVPLVPAVFRYSRAGWVYFERWTCPNDVSAGAFEKEKALEFGRRG